MYKSKSLAVFVCLAGFVAGVAGVPAHAAPFEVLGVADAPFTIVSVKSGGVQLKGQTDLVGFEFLVQNNSPSEIHQATLMAAIVSRRGEVRSTHLISLTVNLPAGQSGFISYKTSELTLRKGDRIVLLPYSAQMTEDFHFWTLREADLNDLDGMPVGPRAAAEQEQEPAPTSECITWCTMCNRTALKACGEGNIKSVTCKWSNAVECSYVCKDSETPQQPSGN